MGYRVYKVASYLDIPDKAQAKYGDRCSPDGNDNEIYFWNGSTTTNISNNGVDDLGAEVDGSNVVWSRWDGNDYEIVLWDESATTQITDNSVDDLFPARRR